LLIGIGVKVSGILSFLLSHIKRTIVFKSALELNQTPNIKCLTRNVGRYDLFFEVLKTEYEYSIA
jgi:hypothetical protein